MLVRTKEASMVPAAAPTGPVATDSSLVWHRPGLGFTVVVGPELSGGGSGGTVPLGATNKPDGPSVVAGPVGTTTFEAGLPLIEIMTATRTAAANPIVPAPEIILFRR